MSGGLPSRTAITLSATSTAIPSRAVAVADPMCGVRTTRSSRTQLGRHLRLALEDVEARASEPTLLQRAGKGSGIDQVAT